MTQPTITQDGAVGARPPATEPRMAMATKAEPPDIRGVLGEWVGETVTAHRDDGYVVVGRLVEASPEHMVIQEFVEEDRYSPTHLNILKSMEAHWDLVSVDMERVLRVTPGD